MTFRVTAVAVLIAATTGSAASAHEDCDIPMADWQPRAAVRSMIEARGWKLDRIKIDDGCYEVRVTDENGRRFEAIVDPSTLEIIDIESHRRHR